MSPPTSIAWKLSPEGAKPTPHQLPGPTILYDEEHTVTYASIDAAQELCSKPEALIGKKIFEVVPPSFAYILRSQRITPVGKTTIDSIASATSKPTPVLFATDRTYNPRSLKEAYLPEPTFVTLRNGTIIDYNTLFELFFPETKKQKLNEITDQALEVLTALSFRNYKGHLTIDGKKIPLAGEIVKDHHGRTICYVFTIGVTTLGTQTVTRASLTPQTDRIELENIVGIIDGPAKVQTLFPNDCQQVAQAYGQTATSTTSYCEARIGNDPRKTNLRVIAGKRKGTAYVLKAS